MPKQENHYRVISNLTRLRTMREIAAALAPGYAGLSSRELALLRTAIAKAEALADHYYQLAVYGRSEYPTLPSLRDMDEASKD